MRKYFIKGVQNRVCFFGVMDIEWISIKVSIVVVLCTLLLFFLFFRTDLRFPSGVCNLVDCRYLSEGTLKWVIALLLVIASGLYVFEIFMTSTTFLISAISVVICSMEESTGMRDENGLLSLVFFAQFLAYAFNNSGIGTNLQQNRVQFPLQVIAAVYFLAGLAKLRLSGLAWFTTDAPYFALEILRRYYCDFASSGSLDLQKMGSDIAIWWANHLMPARLLLCFGLILEVGAFVLLVNKKLAFVYGGFLTAMHIGIYLTLHIFYPSIMLPMIIFTINPVYRLLQLFRWLSGKPKKIKLNSFFYL